LKRGNIILIFSIVIILLINFVSASNACCEVTNDGEYCRYADESECNLNYQSAYATCEQTSYCQIGCCYSSDSGSCFKNTAKSRCEVEEGSAWVDSMNCEIDQCTQGCCVIADQAFFVTEVKCKEIASQYEEVNMDFDESYATEYACLNSVKNSEWGCCANGEDYTFTTRDNCPTASNEPSVGSNFTEEGFNAGMLCSNDLLSADCAKQQHTGCYEGKVYWHDSCGNRENIYSSDITSSYNSGYIKDEEESCTITGPYDKNCGNCDYAAGSVCGTDKDHVMEKGDFTCIDLNCYDTYDDEVSPGAGGDKLNGESWCLYDSFTGEAQDTVGSRHFRQLCINGEEVPEPCTDFREDICIHGVLSAEIFGTLEALHLSDSGDYIEAACRDNRWEDCYDCNYVEEEVGDTSGIIANSVSNEEAVRECCEDEDYRDCFWLEGEVERVDRGSNIPLTSAQQEAEDLEVETTVGGVCVPQVPPGQQFWADDGDASTASTDEVCSEATRTCEATWRIGGWKKIFGGKTNADNWNLVMETPMGCTERDWFVKQNILCKAQGDCGAYYNWNGVASYDGFTSNAFDEVFFFDYDELESKDIGDWDYLINVGGGEIKYYGANSRYWYSNPAFVGAIISGSVGAVSQTVACSKAKEAQIMQGMDSANANNILQSLGGLVGGGGSALGALGGRVTGIDSITGDATTTTDLTSYEKDCGNYANLSSDQQGECDTLAGAIGTSAQKQSNLDFASGAGCFLQGAMPIVGLIGRPVGKVSAKETAAMANSDDPYQAELGTTMQEAQGAKTVTRVSNVLTTAFTVYLFVEYGFDNETTVNYEATCGRWQPPSGGDDCELCNTDEKPCSEYRCRALGASCQVINEGSGNESCVSVYANDVNSPDVTPNTELFSEAYTFRETYEEGNPGLEINELIPAFTPVQIGLETDEPALCKYATEPGIAYEEMNYDFGTDLYLYNHALLLSLGDEVTDEEVIALTEGIYTIYVKCIDYNGNANERDYFVRFQVDTTPDLTPPTVVFTSLDEGLYVAYGVNETMLSVYTDEPATCKWSTEDTDYTIMDNEMICTTSGFQASSIYYGTYPCTGTLTGISSDEINYFYFRCQDSTGNTNEESYKYSTKSSEDTLVIDSMSPEGEVYNTTLEIEVKTSAGADNGVSTCAFSTDTNEYSAMTEFLDTNSTSHSQELNLFTGDYTLYVTCQDVAGNQNATSSEITVEYDDSIPQITSIYVDEVFYELVIEFNEDATCEFASEEFEFGDGTPMGTQTPTHSPSLGFPMYYIICEDIYGNQGSYLLDISLWS
jgi:hypothetical protein